ncbi:hypothetical protein [Bradyrhizobium sp. CCBAU 051011]|uniref:hypothetical protein n=1 Tax=Bradyrhizobium sp. CCBAU 051011 TaxID=858422 RepID=UPI001379598F|nr:hypothetical protein [Bradyrhizobium sp. CCBAU 051011]
MQNAASDGVAQVPHDPDAAHPRRDFGPRRPDRARPERPARIEETIARETSPGGPESSTGAIVLDDVSPRYMKAAAAVQACDVNLGIALRSLLDSGADDPSAACLPALAVVGA